MALTPSEMRRRKMNLLMAMSYAAFASSKASAWSPTLLFASGEQGAWYDPSDFTTMFQDATGTTPVTAVEQPVGLLLDKSKGLALGAEGSPALSEYVTLLTGTWAASGANYIFTDTVGGQSRPGVQYPTTSLVAGWYRVVVVVAAINGATQIRMDGVGATDQLLVVGTNTYTLNVTATSRPRFRLEDLSTTIGDSFTITSISIKALPGNHASQSTAASRPVLSARVNLLTYSEQFDNAAWAKLLLGSALAPTITANAGTDPNGNTTADRAQFSLNGNTASGDLSIVRQSVSVLAGEHTLSVWLRSFDSNSYIMTITAGGAEAFITVTPSWQRFSVSATIASPSSITPSVYLRGARSTTNSNTADVLIWGADLRVTNVGVGLPAYQRVAAATDYDTSGFPLYLKFDGTDDSLATGSIDFSATDKMSVFAGLRKLGTAANEFIAETSVDYSANAGAFTLTARGSSTDYLAFKGGTSGTFNDCYFETDTVPATFVFTGTIDISQALIANESDVRLNGATTSQTHAGTVQTGNFGNYPLYIGRRGGTTFPYNGHLYSLIVRGALSTDAQIASTETWVNGKTKAY